MIERLRIVLEQLRVTEQERPNVRINLMFAIAAHAMLCGDKEMEEAANAEITRLQLVKKQEAEAKAAPTAPAASSQSGTGPSDADQPKKSS